jgi:histidinol phosphatase-like enzyme
MAEALDSNGAHLGGVYVCPHEDGTCTCRKPDVGLLYQAQHDFPAIVLAASDMVGDSLTDLQAGHALGMRLWLVGAPEERAAVGDEAARQGIALSGSADSLADLVRDGGLGGAEVPT